MGSAPTVPKPPYRQSWGQGKECRTISTERVLRGTGGCPQTKGKFFMEPKAGFLSLSGPSLQGVISGTTGQVGGYGVGSQDYSSLLCGSQRALP